MSPIAIGIIIVVAVLLLVMFMFFTGTYNGLIKLRNRYENAYSQIDVQLKRRHDLIPNLVETAKGYMEHEQETLTQVIEARNQAMAAQKAAASNPGQASSMQGMMQAETGLNGALGRLMMIAENYPDLKANQNMMALQEELTSTENKVSYARQGYNDAVTSYNNKREVFPTVVLAGMMGFGDAELLQVDDPEERKVPSVAF